MKNLLKVLSLALVLMTTQVVIAQTQLGAKAALQFSNMDLGNSGIEAIGTANYINSYSVGIILQTELGSGFFFRPELDYTQKGVDLKISKDIDLFGFNIPIGGGARSRINYVDLPLNLGYSFDLGKIKAQVYAGPSLSYATVGTVQTYAKAILNINIYKEDIDFTSDTYNRLGLGGNIGTSLYIPIRTGSIIFDARYSKDITNVFNNPIIDIQLRNKSFAIGIGYMYTL